MLDSCIMSHGQLQKTPLCSRHEQLGARMVDFHGWYLPVQYDGIIAEHQRTRSAVTMFDTCHMGRIFISGPGAIEFLSRVLTTDVVSQPVGRCRYGFILNEDAGIVDDCILYRFDDGRWFLVVNASTCPTDVAWLCEHAPASVKIQNVSGMTGKLDVQGPASPEVVGRILGRDVTFLKYYEFTRWLGRSGEIIVSRTGYTGERGYEVYAAVDEILRLWDEWINAGVRPAGLGARDTLRLEAGLPLYGSELNEELTPAHAGMMRYAAKAADFIGKTVLMEVQKAGPSHVLTGFRVDGRQSARSDNKILAEGADAGWVTSGSFAPTLGCAVGMAYVRRDLAGLPAFDIDIGRRVLRVQRSGLPFYKRV